MFPKSKNLNVEILPFCGILVKIYYFKRFHLVLTTMVNINKLKVILTNFIFNNLV